MKQRIYLRFGRNQKGMKVVASTKSNPSALDTGVRYLPTVQIALDIDIPDSEFEATRIKLEAKIKEAKPCVEIKQVQED